MYLCHSLSSSTRESHNSPAEARMVAIADNFQRQYSHLFPQRRALLLCLRNENGVKVMTATSVPKQPVGDICVLTPPVPCPAEVCVHHPPAHGSGAPGTSPLEGLRGLCGRLPVPEASGVTGQPGEDGYVSARLFYSPPLCPPPPSVCVCVCCPSPSSCSHPPRCCRLKVPRVWRRRCCCAAC